MLSVEQALERVLEGVEPLAPVLLPLAEAYGLRLAEPLLAQEDQPAFASSAMDGYAVFDLKGPGQLVGEVAAGQLADFTLGPGQIARIFTGAPIPAGTRAVVPQEEMQGLHYTAVEKAHIRPAGEHFLASQRMLSPGQPLHSGALGLAALMGYPQVRCYRPAQVGLISSGDELIELDQPLGPAQVRNSNLYTLEAQLRACGALPKRYPIVPDEPRALRQALELAVSENDLVVTCGGASVGDRDYIQSVLQEMGAEVGLWRVAMRPGKPLGLAHLRGKRVLALPGNPVSSYVTFELFGRPLIDRLQGGPGQGLARIVSRLVDGITKKKGLTFFLRGQLGPKGVQVVGSQASHLFRSVLESDGLVELPQAAEACPAGEQVEVLLWPWVKASCSGA